MRLPPHSSVGRAPSLFIATAFGIGCASGGKPTLSPSPQPACVISATGSVPGPINVSAVSIPGPFHSAQLHQTVLNVDCENRLYAGLARGWTLDETRTRITLTLGEDAHFWNGDVVRAADIVDAWRATSETPGEVGALARRIVAGTTVVDDRTLLVSLPDTQASVLASPALIVYRRTGVIAEGTGRFHPKEETSAIATLASSIASAPDIAITRRQKGDARDAIDARADLILDPDPIALDYAATRPEYATVLLPWNRTYVLAMPSVTGVPSSYDSTFRATLARDVVRTDARSADIPAWWSSTAGCPVIDAGSATGSAQRPRIVYRSDDNVARAIAERLVALSPGRATSAGLGASAFDEAVRTGADLAYVLALPRRSMARCVDLVALRTRIPWAATGMLTPLVDTRDRVIVRAGRVPATIDWDGTLRIGPP